MDNKGQVLVEAIVAITIATVGLLGIFGLMNRSLSLNRQTGDQYVAANLAMEGVEVIKNMIDNNIIQGLPWNNGISDGIYEVMYNDAGLSRKILGADPVADCNSAFILQDENTDYLDFDPITGIYGYGFSEQTRYKRGVCVRNLLGGNEIQVNAIIVWTTRGQAVFDINLEDHFYNWRPEL